MYMAWFRLQPCCWSTEHHILLLPLSVMVRSTSDSQPLPSRWHYRRVQAKAVDWPIQLEQPHVQLQRRSFVKDQRRAAAQLLCREARVGPCTCPDCGSRMMPDRL
jgi:hypothetical protein